VSPAVTIPRGLFLALSLAAGAGKLLDMPGFYAIVENYRMLPRALAPLAKRSPASDFPASGICTASGWC
jgi:hypothetical protein